MTFEQNPELIPEEFEGICGFVTENDGGKYIQTSKTED